MARPNQVQAATAVQARPRLLKPRRTSPEPHQRASLPAADSPRPVTHPASLLQGTGVLEPRRAGRQPDSRAGGHTSRGAGQVAAAAASPPCWPHLLKRRCASSSPRAAHLPAARPRPGTARAARPRPRQLQPHFTGSGQGCHRGSAAAGPGEVHTASPWPCLHLS
jgi:hypothetical protein